MKIKAIRNISFCAVITFLLLCVAPGKTAEAHVAINSSPTTSCSSIDSTDFTTHTSNQIDNRLALASSTNGLATYTARPTTSTSSVWTRNPNVWTNEGVPLDFTGVAGWNDASGYQRGGTLITPRDFISANHFYIPVGNHVIFYDANGNPVERTVVGSQDILDSNGVDTDINVEALDSDVPDSITYYPILASSTLESLLYTNTSQTIDVPIVIFNQDSTAMVQSMDVANFSSIGHFPYTSGTRAPFSLSVRTGDSGQPGFVLADGEPILLFTNYSAVGGPNLGYYISQINAALTSLGSNGYQVTQYNPTCFIQYPVNHVPQFVSTPIISLNQSLYPNNNPLATFTATDADVGQTLTYSLTSLSSVSASTSMPVSNFFSINPATGALYETAPIDTSVYGSALTLGVAVTDNATYPASTTASVRINIYSAINPAFTINPAYTTSILGASSSPSYVAFDGSDNLYVASGVPIDTSASSSFLGGIVRLTSSGNLDSTFNSGLYVPNGTVLHGLILQNDGKALLVGGPFTYGTSSSYIVRLNTDGSVDLPFINMIGTGPSLSVTAVGLYNNQILISGRFTTFNGTSTPRLVRLNSDGTIDSTFQNNIGIGFSSLIGANAIVQEGNQIVIGGSFTSFNGITFNRILRLNSDGTLDTLFASSSGSGFNGTVNSLGVLSNGKIVVGGFTSYNSSSTPGIALLNTDGTLNTQFQSNLVSLTDTYSLLSAYVQPDDKILISANGNAMTIGGRPVGTLARLNSDGTLDSSFQNNIGIGTDASITSIAEKSDGSIAIVGLFTKIDSQSVPHFAVFKINTSVPISTGGGSAPSSVGGGGGGSTYITPNTTNATTTSTLASTSTIQIAGCILGGRFNIFTGGRCVTTATPSLPLSQTSNPLLIIVPVSTSFTTNLSFGANNTQVKLLQHYLNTHGFTVSKSGSGSLGNETTVFGPATRAALIAFQKEKDISPASGYFGPITRAYIAEHR